MDDFFETDIPDENVSLEENLVTISKKLLHNPDDRILLRQYSQNLLLTNNKSNYKTALDYAKKSLSIKPNDYQSKILVAKSLRLLERYLDAIDYVERIESEFPDNDEILREMSSCLLSLNRNTEAEKILKKLQTISPKKAIYNLGWLHLNYQNYKIALGKFSEVLEQNPSHILSTIQKIYAMHQLGRTTDAIWFSEKFIIDYPEKSDEIWPQLAGLCYESGSESLEKNGYVEKKYSVDGKIVTKYELPEESEKFFRQALNAYRTIDDLKISTPETAYWKSLTLSKLGLFSDALVAIDESLQQPKHWDILSYKCHVLYRLGRYEEALRTSEDVLKDFPRDNVALCAKVNSLWGLQRISEYESEFEKLMKINNDIKKLKNSDKKIIEYFPINPDTPFANWEHWTELFSTFAENIWIKDRYPNRKLLNVLYNYVDKNSVNEIKILSQASLELGGKDFVNNNRKFPERIQKFNEEFKNKCTLEIRIHFDPDPGHDRYIMSQDSEWNTTGMDQIDNSQRSDIYKIPNHSQVSKDKIFFKKLWNKSTRLDAPGWSTLLDKLEKKLKESNIPSQLDSSDRSLK